ncbi:mucin-like glycoprotein [Trypanosoma rangeli]|uniref:Mucin-like glycoprotein n=1 Tax=Trypanosoma rangeli TaxID=5698 RepID=A0A3R7KIZ0_TRYRA|nr:mucin-like glycoprotein [Trypanosoma rangeli]RNE95396.1 mucin-like glycoprotein [Trypanosoma rangeli]|eukprot:RNE95396.1 mucin-like glycoprotein [Trypanosoma rangeli]
MAMATVRRRAVWALAVLAVLCGCCFSVCGATPPKMNVKVEVSCPKEGEKISLRFSGDENSEWKECSKAVNYYRFRTAKTAAESSNDGDPICSLAESWCISALKEQQHLRPSAAEGSNVVVLTMNCTVDDGSALRKLSNGQIITLDGTDGKLLGRSGVCNLQDSPKIADAATLKRQTVGGQSFSPQPPAAPEVSSSVATQQDGTSASGSEVTEAPAAEQSVGTDSTGPHGTLSPPNGAAGPSKATGDSGADGHGGTQAPSTSAEPSGTSASNTPAGSDGESATTATTSSSPSGGKHTEGNADGSGTPTVWVRGTLLLLLTAALACAAGE